MNSYQHHHTAEMLRLLNQDVMGEHQAILQYLQHAWALAETYGPTIEGIARDEMRHLKWLSHMIVRYGGIPDLAAPSAENQDLESGLTLIVADVAAEDAAIELYEEHRRVIDDGKVTALIGRILIDERDHRRQFETMAEAWAHAEPAPRPTMESAATASRVQRLIAQEYRAILSLLAESFRHGIGNGSLDGDYEERAIEEMKHLGWLGALLGQAQVAAHFPISIDAHEPVDEAREVGRYQALRVWANQHDPQFACLLDRIQAHEAYQALVTATGPTLTVGSLRSGGGEESLG